MGAQRDPRLLSGVAVAATLVATILTSPTPAASDVSFKDKTINIIVTSNPGGGTDGFARMMGTYLAKYLEGEPQVVYRHLPAGGGLTANNYFYGRAAPDGLTAIGASQEQLSSAKLLHEASKYNPAEYEFVGGFTGGSNPFIVRAKDRPRLTDSNAKPLVYGDPTGERPGTQALAWAKEYLGWNIRFVLGYASTGAVFTAFRSGEVDIQMNYMATSYLVDQKGESGADKLEVVAHFGKRSEDGATWSQRHPGLADAPAFDDLIRPKLDATALRAYEIWVNGHMVDKWMALPPKTPDDIAATYRKAFSEIVKDKSFIETLTKMLGFSEAPAWLYGEQLREIAKRQAATKREDLAFFIELRKKHGLPVLER